MKKHRATVKWPVICSLAVIALWVCVAVFQDSGVTERVQLKAVASANMQDADCAQDLPDVWYDEDGRSLTLEARNVKGFFFLTILEQRTSAVKFNDKVGGAGNRIPLNGYAPGEYRVSLTNPSGCQFIGFFTVKEDIP